MATKTEWMLVADAARARIFEVDAAKGALVRTPVREMTAETLASREIGSDRPGRSFDSAGQGRHAMEPPTDPHRYEKRRFAHDLAEVLEDERKKGNFGRLYLVAPPQMLGDLREALSDGLRRLVGCETAKDLAMLAPHEIEEHLDEVLGR